MSSRTISLACLSEARSTMRRARLRASALSGAGLRSPASWVECLSMKATIAPAGRSLRVEFVNSSGGFLACLVEGQPRGDGIQKRCPNRLVDGHLVRIAAAGDLTEQHLADFAT